MDIDTAHVDKNPRPFRLLGKNTKKNSFLLDFYVVTFCAGALSSIVIVGLKLFRGVKVLFEIQTV